MTPEQWEILAQGLAALIVAILALLGYDVGIAPLAAKISGRALPPQAKEIGRLVLVGLLLAALLGLGFQISEIR